MKIFYSIDPESWSEAQIQQALKKLPVVHQNRIKKYSNRQKMQQRLCAMQLFRKAASDADFVKYRLDAGQLTYERSGKPQLNDVLDLSFAYREDFTLLAITDRGKIGADVEKHKDIDIEVFKDYFTPREWRWIHELPAVLTRFYDTWTRKEALAKALGEGMLMELHSLDVLDDSFYRDGAMWNLKSRNVHNNYYIAVASTDPDFSDLDIKFHDNER